MLDLCVHYILEKCEKVSKYVKEAENEAKNDRVADAEHLLRQAKIQAHAMLNEIKQAQRGLEN